jgi:hypothetical protein
MLKEQPYSQAEADAASGLGVEKYMKFVQTYEQSKKEKDAQEKQKKEIEMVID